MIDSVLFAGRVLLIALLYIFLFAIMKTGIGLVRGQGKSAAVWTLTVERGPKELRGVKTPVRGPITVGRSPGADIVINDTFVSGRHARFSPLGDGLTIEDLGSTNGTLLNGRHVTSPVGLQSGEAVTIGDVVFKVTRR